ncbi:MAG: gamma carbonic anhydrase family protein [Bdellovibrionaceae bacterium]|nr:gamma carbonic anhydrase family protein [Pseudobdellovibrionaceae bacterium]|tara:strand:- start:6552 stop:7055 length:504 start_codon:yes stop_codon:yes gene_type:complete
MIHKARGFEPKIDSSCFVAPSAEIIGNVTVGKKSSIWYNTTLRGDVMPIAIGDETNIQDGTVIHGTFEKAAAQIGNRVTIGHSVILHGCRVDDLCLIGMGSILMDDSHIPERCVVGAGSLVTEGSKFESGWLILGRPAKTIRPLNEKELKFLDQSADNYMKYTEWYE